MQTRLLISIGFITILCVVIEFIKKFRIQKYAIFTVAILIYLGGVVYLTLFYGGRQNITGISIKFPLPFTQAILNQKFGLVAYRSLLNILLFVPFGYLLPNICLQFERKILFWQVVVFGFSTSLIIEIMQLAFHRGVYELDDLVKNTIGTAVGYFLFWLLNRIFEKRHET